MGDVAHLRSLSGGGQFVYKPMLRNLLSETSGQNPRYGQETIAEPAALRRRSAVSVDSSAGKKLSMRSS